MILQDIINNLKYSELRGIKLGNSNREGITEADYPQLIHFINLALTDLHTRFQIRTETIQVELAEETSVYRLEKGNSYIMDSVDDPFQDNIINILSIKDEAGDSYVLNDPTDCDSILLPLHNAIDVPNPVTGNTLMIRYHANHPRINDNTPRLDENIDLPDGLMKALLAFVKNKAYASLTTVEATNIALSAEADYLREVQRIEDDGVVQSEAISNKAFEVGSWA